MIKWATAQPNPDPYEYAKFSPSMAIIVVVLIIALFFEQHPNERPPLTRGYDRARADQRWICGRRKKGLEEEKRDGEAVRRERWRKENEGKNKKIKKM